MSLFYSIIQSSISGTCTPRYLVRINSRESVVEVVGRTRDLVHAAIFWFFTAEHENMSGISDQRSQR